MPAPAPARGLTPEQVGAYRANGHLSPLPALSRPELEASRRGLDALLQASGGTLGPEQRQNLHLVLEWASALGGHPAILDAVSALIGPDILVWRSTLFVKPPRDEQWVAWHQDSAYWDLMGDDIVTAWIALTESRAGNGCVRVVSGTHAAPPLPHALGLHRGNLLLRGQAVAAPLPDRVTNLELAGGEFSLHHAGLVHGSLPNRSDQWRVGLAVRYLAPHVRPRRGRYIATLVRGRDAAGHFDLAPRPQRDHDPALAPWYARSLDTYAHDVAREVWSAPTPRHLLMAARILADARLRRYAWNWLRRGGWRSARGPR